MGSQVGVVIAALVAYSVAGAGTGIRAIPYAAVRRRYGSDHGLGAPVGLLAHREPHSAATRPTQGNHDEHTAGRWEHLTMRFGGLVAIDDLSFRAKDREIYRHHRPQWGPAKTTVFNCLTGFYRPTVGALNPAQDHAPLVSGGVWTVFRISRAGVCPYFPEYPPVFRP